MQANFGRLFGPVQKERSAGQSFVTVDELQRLVEKLTCGHVLNLSHDEHTILTNHFPKHDVLSIEERCWLCRDEELASVRMRSRVGLEKENEMRSVEGNE